MPQKGKIVISKTGEIFASVTEVNCIYQPVYTVTPLAGAVYEIYAAEDIYILDGILRYAKDELVETVTTGEDGTATSKEIYLGRYYVVEITAPDGYYLSDDQELTTHYVELTYKGQEYVLTDDAEGVQSGHCGRHYACHTFGRGIKCRTCEPSRLVFIGQQVKKRLELVFAVLF